MKPVILVVGCPAAGKSTVCEKLKDTFVCVPHDDYEEKTYSTILARCASASRAVLGEIPFGLSKIQGELEARGLKVVPVFLYEEEPVLRARWAARGMTNASTIKGHLKRQETYRERAHELGAFLGSADQVLEHLKKLEL